LVAGPEQIKRAQLCYPALKRTGALITKQFTGKIQSLFPEYKTEMQKKWFSTVLITEFQEIKN
jgi:hypothetical protein